MLRQAHEGNHHEGTEKYTSTTIVDNGFTECFMEHHEQMCQM